MTRGTFGRIGKPSALRVNGARRGRSRMSSGQLAEAGVLAACALAVLPSTAHAYLDPGSGSMALQILLATALGAVYAVRAYWRKIRARFTRPREEVEAVDTND